LKQDPLDLSKSFPKGRLVGKGYEQVPGVDYTETFLPVATDTSVRAVWAISLYYQEVYDSWTMEMVDVETAFLNADLDEEIYIEVPEGAEVLMDKSDGEPYDRNTEVLRLKKAIYGLVQAPRAWMKTCTKILKGLGLTKCMSGPCLFYKKDDNGNLILLINVYVDDMIICGLKREVTKVKKDIKRHVNIKEIGEVTKHLGVECKYSYDEEGPYMTTHMTKFVNAVIKDYEKFIGKELESYKSPGINGEVLMRTKARR